ncbi:MAG: 50S ribosomal protein L21 [Clostridia bacterium]|nr:50S ribosomal protein L21 [Oscillospiraceae bacterium]MBQ1955717.1 50S ribosomal protein L21 [Clostridia bacterium]
MYAVFEACGKQYKVQEGDIVFLEKLGAEVGENVKFDKVTVISKDDGIVVGAPYVEGAVIEASVMKNAKAKKVLVFKYNAKKNYRRRQGHRQPYTKVQINKING